jgi:glycosyltransferase involved in cell wall biosynthesis
MEWCRDSHRPELAVVMPIYNESANIGTVVREWFQCFRKIEAGFLFLAINDGSTDSTETILSALSREFGPRFRVVNKKNSGHGRSCREGYEIALTERIPWILQIDSDGQCDPAFFEDFYKRRGDHDCLFGYRRTRDDGLGRMAISFCCRMLLWMTTGTYLRDPNVPYRLMRSTAVRTALRKIPADFDLQNIALTFALKREPQLNWKHFPIHFRARQGGENSINFGKIVKMGINLLRDFSRITHEDSHTWRRPHWARRRMAS